MPVGLDGFLWLLLLLGPFLVVQRGLHREVQAIFLLITRRVDIALALFSVLFFPGILLHESSHYLMARLCGVRTGRFSLIPRPLEDGRLQLGFVETAPADWLREALIGAAPLLTGGLFVAYAGLALLGLLELWQALVNNGPSAFMDTLLGIFSQPDFWLWFYLAFTVSSTMLPSASDRRAWLPLGLVLAALLALSVLAGAGPWLLANLAEPLNIVLKAVAVVFGISMAIHLALLLPVWVLRVGLSRLLKLDVVV